jgi:4-amino-4-deoxychorismate lyase
VTRTPSPAQPDLVLVNGEPSGLSPLDRGLHFGDGLFETIACCQGRARFLSLHLERLALGCERLQIRLATEGVVRREIERLAAGTGDSLIKLIVTRGAATARGYSWVGDESATRVALRYPGPHGDEAAARDGVRVRIGGLRLGENAALAGLKHLNRLENVLARSELRANDVAELLLFSSSGTLVSGTMSNVFIVHNDRLMTPRLDLCGVLGVMRRVVLREAAGAGITVEERVMAADDLNRAHEIFLTNARMGIWPVRELEGRMLSPGGMTRRLQALMKPMLVGPADA